MYPSCPTNKRGTRVTNHIGTSHAVSGYKRLEIEQNWKFRAKMLSVQRRSIAVSWLLSFIVRKR